MKAHAVDAEALKSLPDAISVERARQVYVYHGTPVEMVRQMASEMGPNVTVHNAIGTLLTALYRNRGVLIAIPEDAPEEIVAAVFVHALLDTGIFKPITAQG